MTKKETKFQPDWREDAPVQGSYRSIFKWGDPLGFKHPNRQLYAMMKEHFGMTDDDFKEKKNEGNEQVSFRRPVKLTDARVKALSKIVGMENVSQDNYSRLRYATGKTIEEAMKLRQGTVERVPDIVLHPRDKNDVRAIVRYCNREQIPVYVYGGGSSVNFGLRPARGGVTLVMGTHMNRILELNETDQTVTVQPGMMGPDYESALNNAPDLFGSSFRYTGGHFPQSFEFSSVGGWVLTLGSGQQSSYYGDAGDLVMSQEYITPAGEIKTLVYPAAATGPKLNDIMKGSEGTFGVLVEMTMKVYRYMPENRRKFGFIFPSWESAVEAGRAVSQGEFGMPSVFRISDPEETDVAMKLYGIEGTPIDSIIRLRGFKPMQRCLLIGHTEGEKAFSKNVKKKVLKTCRSHGGMYITGYPVKNWEHGRYADPYMREDLQDYGIMTDTLETTVTWSNLHKVHRGVREFVKSRPGTICMTHCSHFYPQGTNLYFIFIARMDDIKEYIAFQDGIIERINMFGGSLSHHHGIGRMIAPWIEDHLGKEQMAALRALKKHFDPKGIMNPGGQLGLDLKGKNWRKIK